MRTDSELIEVDPDSRRVVIHDNLHDGKDTIGYDLLHVVPTQSAPDWLKATKLAVPDNPFGYVDIDKNTMRHTRFDNIFALGDVGSSPTPKRVPRSASKPPSSSAT